MPHRLTVLFLEGMGVIAKYFANSPLELCQPLKAEIEALCLEWANQSSFTDLTYR